MGTEAYKTGVLTDGYVAQRPEFVLSPGWEMKPITVDRGTARYSASMTGPFLAGRQIAGVGKYAPFFVTALLASQAAAAQKNIVLATTGVDGIANYKSGDVIIIMDDNHYEERTIDTVTAGTNTIAVTVNLTYTYETADNAKVYLKDGTEDSENVVIIPDSIDFSLTDDIIVSAYTKGSFDKPKVNRNTNFVADECQRIFLDNPQSGS